MIKSLQLQTASRKVVNIEVTMPLFIGMGDPRVRAWFGLFENLAIDVLLRALFIDRCIRKVFYTESKIVLWHSRAVAIISTNSAINSIKANNTVFTVNTHSQDYASSEEFIDVALHVKSQ